MPALLNTLPTTVAELQQLQIEKLAIIEQHEKTIASSKSLNNVLQEKQRLLNQKHFTKSSEKNPGQAELQFLNEAEMLHSQEVRDEVESEEETLEIDAPAHKLKQAKKRELPADLPRCDVFHDLSDEQKRYACGQTMSAIGDEVLEQLAIVPQQFYVIVHHRLKYACTCKSCMRTATLPAQPIPGSQASAQIISHVMTSKYHDGLPLYRQEKMAKREGLDLDRSKLASFFSRFGTACRTAFTAMT